MGKFISTLSLVFLIQGFPTNAYAQQEQNTEQKPNLVNLEEQPQNTPQSSNAIKQVVAANLMTNYSDGNFYPERLVSRAELATIMVKTFRLDRRNIPPEDVTVADVPSSHWAYKDIQTVLKTGIMRGYRGNLFFPNQRVTRAEGLAIFAQAYGVFQFSDDTVTDILSNYSDVESIPNWARRAIATVVAEGFINDTQGKLNPLKPMTRGDIASVLSEYLERQQQQPNTPVVPGGSVNPQPGF
ncbi:S-layer homology domain-containing protein [Plectonema cf. radiosum LEGE 06105]|uniref:S-layer homology domain-containing protein n=2 Tax=Plectonema TaxID=1183 RepID=A0A8J7F630_9CYAN|nr:S-layer homology domain-containing protein [Plectonema cf. radiosum LEGE 06105]